jgi:hypothetical protein
VLCAAAARFTGLAAQIEEGVAALAAVQSKRLRLEEQKTEYAKAKQFREAGAAKKEIEAAVRYPACSTTIFRVLAAVVAQSAVLACPYLPHPALVWWRIGGCLHRSKKPSDSRITWLPTGTPWLGESKWLVVESSWSQLTSECQRFGHPPRLNK